MPSIRRHNFAVRAIGAFATLLAGVATALPLACDRGGSDATTAQGELAIVVSGDTAGWLTPCGCTANQSGGLARRATYLNQLAQSASAVLYLDAGGSPGGDSPYQRAKFRAILAGERAMAVAAHNLGVAELSLGADSLRALARDEGVPFISANARDRYGAGIAEPFQIVERGGRRIAVIGVVSPALLQPDGEIRADEPRAAILSAIDACRGQADLIVVLAYVPQAELESLASALPEVDAIIGGPTGQSIVPRTVGATVLASATRKGKFVVELRAPLIGRPDASASRVIELNPSFADDRAQLDNLHAYLTMLEARDFDAFESGLVAPMPANAPAGFRVAGDATCVACHRAERASWTASKHAHAWQTLVDRGGYQFDSSCQQCHTTGFGLPGGFESARRSPDRVNVGCESCHGPSQAHVESPRSARTPWPAFEQCVRCHDIENSPTFDRPAYWARIAHGRPATTEGNR